MGLSKSEVVVKKSHFMSESYLGPLHVAMAPLFVNDEVSCNTIFGRHFGNNRCGVNDGPILRAPYRDSRALSSELSKVFRVAVRVPSVIVNDRRG